jgi:predicted nucleic acid-binding protein
MPWLGAAVANSLADQRFAELFSDDTWEEVSCSGKFDALARAMTNSRADQRFAELFLADTWEEVSCSGKCDA